MSLTFEDQLLKLGYPKNSLVSEFQLDNQHVADLVVIHPDTKEPLALFEMKQGGKLNRHQLKAQLEKYQTYFETHVPAYLVQQFGKKTTISAVSGLSVQQLPHIPKFDELTTGRALRKLRSRHHTVDAFSALCWGLAGSVGVLFLFDLLGWIHITAERLGVIAIIIGLSIIPFVNKLKVYWFEYEKKSS